MPSAKERLVSVASGLVGLVASLAVVWYGYALYPPVTAGWSAVLSGSIVLVGLTGAFAALFLLLLPALLPVR